MVVAIAPRIGKGGYREKGPETSRAPLSDAKRVARRQSKFMGSFEIWSAVAWNAPRWGAYLFREILSVDCNGARRCTGVERSPPRPLLEVACNESRVWKRQLAGVKITQGHD